MTDDLSTVEDRVGRALGELASTTTVSPDGWDCIERRVSGRRRGVRTARWIAAPALAVAAAVVLAAFLQPGPGDGPSVVAGPAPTNPGGPTARYAPVGIDGYRLEAAGISGGTGPAADASPVHVYGRRAADGVRLDAFILVVTAGSAADASLLRSADAGDLDLSRPRCMPAAGCFGTPAKEATLRGRQMTVVGMDGGFKVVWDEPGGPTVGVLTRDVPEDAVPAIVEGIRLDGGVAVGGAVPDGFAEVHRGVWPPAPTTLTRYLGHQSWVAADPGQRFTLEVHEGPDLSLDTIAWLIRDAELAEVNGSPALASTDGGQAALAWLPRPGVLVVVTAPERNVANVLSVAESVRELDEDEWRALMGGQHTSLPPGRPKTLPVASPRIAEGDMPGGHWTAVNVLSSGPPQVCIDAVVSGSEAHGCAEVEPPGPTMGRAQLIPLGPTVGGNFLVVPVARSVGAVQFTQWDGSMAAIPPTATAGLAFPVVIIQLGSAAAPDVLVALDVDGREVGRQSLPKAPVPPGAAPAAPLAPPLAPPTVAPPPVRPG